VYMVITLNRLRLFDISATPSTNYIAADETRVSY
jgi:hypothetical protein